jgi:hypothetical protein
LVPQHPPQIACKYRLRKNAGFEKKESLSGFYETAVESKDIPLCFLLLGVFVFAFVFAVAGTRRTLRRIHLGLLYALEESRQGLGA